MADEWDITKPIDHTTIGDLPGEIRKLKASTKTQLDHEHETPVDGDATGSEHSLGSAVLYLGTSAPTNRPDGATALAVNNIDKSRLWLDTNYSPPIIKKWSGTAWVPVTTVGAIPIDSATGVAATYIQNLFGEDGDGERVCRLIAKAAQSGDELTTLGYMEFSHEGASDDQKGQFKILINDGDDSNAPSKQPIGYKSTGKIDVANSLSVLDEDTLVSNDNEVLATQQSIKAYIDSKFSWIKFTVTAADSVSTQGNRNASVAGSGGSYTVTWGTDFATANYCCVVSIGPATNEGSTAIVVSQAEGTIVIRYIAPGGSSTIPNFTTLFFVMATEI